MKKSVSVIAFILALLLVLPMIPVFATEEAATATPQPKIPQSDLAFNGGVNMYFYMYLGKNVDLSTECGMIFWKEKPADGEATYDNALALKAENESKVELVDGKNAVNDTYTSAKGNTFDVKRFRYPVEVTEMADSFWMQGYVSNGDGTYTVGKVIEYSPQIYAKTRLYGENAETQQTLRDLIVAMLDFGAKAQIHFNHNTDNLANSIIRTEVSAADSEALNNALESEDKELYIKLDAGTYTLDAVAGKIVTVTGSESSVIDMTSSGIIDAQNQNLDITFDGVTVKFADTADYKGITHSAKVTYTNCVIEGKQFMYADEVEFKNCTFINYEDYSVWTYGAKNVTFTGCTFLSGGKAILIYQERHEGDATPSNNVTVNNCTFYDYGNLNTVKAAIEIGDSQPNQGLTVNLTATNNTIYGFAENDEGTATGTKMYGNKNSIPSDRLVVTASNNKEYEGAEHYVFTAE